MTLYEYNLMSQEERASHLWDKGKFLANRANLTHRISLYALHGFYVEVLMDSESQEIDRIRSFSSSEQLAPYLDLINLDLPSKNVQGIAISC
jgi:hypothetical protein